MGWQPQVARWATLACLVGAPLLLAGADLHNLWPAPQPALEAQAGDTVTLDVQGALDNGTRFLDERHLAAVLGSGDLVPGLDAALEGQSPGHAFAAVVAPAQGYGAYDPARVTNVSRIESLARVFQVSRYQFEAAIGQPPAVGEVVQARLGNATVIDAGDPVALRYDLRVGDTVQLYRYWPSRIVAVGNQTLQAENELHVGDQIHLPARSGPGRTVRVTAATPDAFVLDANPPLAGRTLHFTGKLLSVTPGKGVRRQSDRATSLGVRSCEACHGGAGFTAVTASAAATTVDGRTVVNVTLEDPWLHDVRDLTVWARVNGTRGATQSAAPLAAQKSGTLQLVLPAAPPHSTVQLVVNATAHHTHQSGGKPDDLPYQLTLSVPVGGARQGSAVAPASTAARALDAVGSLTGFAALAALAFPSVQGLRRHLGRKPWLRVPRWLTSHLLLSVACIALTLVHAEALLSGTWHGDWEWGVLLGLLALFLLGVMGLTGAAVAGWSRWRSPGARRLHYLLMLAVVVASVVHTLAVGTHLGFLRGR